MMYPSNFTIDVAGKTETMQQHNDPYILKTQVDAIFSIKNEIGIEEDSDEKQHNGEQDYILAQSKI